MSTAYFARQAQALTFYKRYTTSSVDIWADLVKQPNFNSDMIITSLRVMIESVNANGEILIAMDGDTDVIFSAKGNGEYYPSYQVFSKDSPCYLMYDNGTGTDGTEPNNVTYLRLFRKAGMDPVVVWVSYIRMAESTGFLAWGDAG